nr:GNAT family N-acetyltransferase [uncultured Halomonas sp.]
MSSRQTVEITLRQADTNDAVALVEIYNHYITSSIATFEEQPITPAEMASRLVGVQDAGLPWWVALDEATGTISGYAYATRWKPRSAYRHSVEASVYLADGMIGRGLGRRLASAVLKSLDECGIHVVLAGIALPNPASVALHEALGFEKVAHLRDVGRKFERWIDVGYWQRVL